MVRGKWEQQTGNYQYGENYRIGKIIVASAFYRSGSRDAPAKYAVRLELPGIKNPSDLYTNLEDAKARAERAVSAWFKWLEEKD